MVEASSRGPVGARALLGCLEDATTHHSFRQLETARSRLYRRRFWPPNNHFSAFFKIYKICTLLLCSKLKMLRNFVKNLRKISKVLIKLLQKFEFRAVQKRANLVDLERCCKITIWWPKSASIQPRTSLGKSDVTRAMDLGSEAARPVPRELLL